MSSPSQFKAVGRRFWTLARKEREFSDSHDVERLSILCKTLDDLADDESTIRAQGRHVQDRFGQVQLHPALKTIAENRVLVLRIIRELGLDLAIPEDPRKPRQYQ